jgi:hypothetical protein
MAEALTVLALQKPFWGNMYLHQDLQIAEFSQGM